jgi:hypothetical protein
MSCLFVLMHCALLQDFTNALQDLFTIWLELGELIGSGRGPIASDNRNDHIHFHSMWRRLQRAYGRFLLGTGIPPTHLDEACTIAYSLAVSPTRTTTQVREGATAIQYLIKQQLAPYLV